MRYHVNFSFLVVELLAYGADIDARDAEGALPIARAASSSPKVLALLRKQTGA